MDALKGIQIDTEIIPEGCLSCVEEASYITSVVEEDFNALMEETGCEDDDDNDDFTNESVILTESKLNEIGNKIVVALQKAWGAIKKMFNDLINWIKEKVNEFKKKNLKKKIDAAMEGIKLKGDAKLGKFHEGSKISNMDWLNQISVSSGFFKNYVNDDDDEASEVESLPRIVASHCGYTGNDNIDVSTMKDYMKKYFLGDEVEITGKDFNKSAFVAILEGSQLSDVKKAYNAVRTQINDYIKSVKGWTKNGSTTKAGDAIYTYNKDNRTEGKAYGKRLKWLKRCSQILTQGSAVQCDAIRQQNREALSIIVAASRKGNKAPKPEAAIFAW